MSTPPLPTGVEDDLPHRVANRLHSLSIHLLRHARVADTATGLSPQRLSLLSILVYAGDRTVGELAALEQVSPPAISRIASALERQGLVERQRDPSDRRVVRLSATAAGTRLLEGARARRLERLADLLAPIDEGALAGLEGALEALTEAVSARGAMGSAAQSTSGSRLGSLRR
ncbi:MAG: MarR family transcriptional regulator [Thermoanaerobaculia bacterium]